MHALHSKRRAVLFVSLTMLVTYVCWGTFYGVHKLTGVRVFSDSPTGLLMMIGLFAPTVIALLLRLQERDFKRKSNNKTVLLYAPLAIFLTITLGLIEVGLTRLIEMIWQGASNTTPLFTDSTIGGVVSAFLASLIFGGLEELGWRGYLLPKLLHYTTPLRATLITGSA
ncbi:MAG: hypothetical protein ACRC5C_06710 [Bacilli bacterium]